MQIISQHLLTSSEKVKIRTVFHIMDDDYNGNLDIDELTEGFEKMKVENAAHEAQRIFDLVDFDGNGSIEFQEWCTISLDWD